MSDHRRRGIAVYIGVGVIVVASVFAYQIHNNQRLSRQDKVSCANRHILIENQRTVLGILAGNIQAFITLPQHNVNRAFFRGQLELVRHAQDALAQTPICTT